MKLSGACSVKIKSKLLTGILIAICTCGHAQTTSISGMDKLEWEKIMADVWKASVGETELNALDYADPPKIEAIKELGDTPYPFQ